MLQLRPRLARTLRAPAIEFCPRVKRGSWSDVLPFWAAEGTFTAKITKTMTGKAVVVLGAQWGDEGKVRFMGFRRIASRIPAFEACTCSMHING